MGRAAGRMQGLARGFMVALLMSAFARPVSAQDGAGVLVAVPSGQEVRWIDTISDAPGPEGYARHLVRMQLDQPQGLKEELYQRLLLAGLQAAK